MSLLHLTLIAISIQITLGILSLFVWEIIHTIRGKSGSPLIGTVFAITMLPVLIYDYFFGDGR